MRKGAGATEGNRRPGRFLNYIGFSPLRNQPGGIGFESGTDVVRADKERAPCTIWRLACDYDGTLASNEQIDDATLAALERSRPPDGG